MDQPVLVELLDAGLRFAPEYHGGLSNHLPMALCALRALGASDARLRSFFDGYVRRLEPDATRKAPLGDWRTRRGDLAAYGQLSATFHDAVLREGIPNVLRRILPELVAGVGAAAFHGLIRTAYAVESGHSAETAAALAYWTCRYFSPAPQPPTEPRLLEPPEWIASIAAASAGWRSDRRLISDRMQDVARSEAVARVAVRLDVRADTLPKLAAIARDRYRASRNFTVLHLMTSCHAMRVLMGHIDDPSDALRWYAPAYAAALVASGVDLHTPAPSGTALSWKEVAARAIASDDDHVIKLVYTCREEARAYEEGPYLHAATLPVGD